MGGLLLCYALSFFFAAFFGYLTGKLYNRTRGQEMIAGLIVGYFANGVYQFLFLFAVGGLIAVTVPHPMIMDNGIGVRMTVDLVELDKGGLKYVIDNIYQAPFVYAVLVISLAILAAMCFVYYMNKRGGHGRKNSPAAFAFNALLCLIAVGIAAYAINARAGYISLPPVPMLDSWVPRLARVRNVPVVTGLLILALCAFTSLIMKTKLGQDFRSVGQSQHIAEVSGINIDRTRIIATIISTVLAAWGQLIYLQNMGTLNTYGAHTQIGLFSVAALLVGGASASRASITNAILGIVLFHAMFIISPEMGKSLFGQAVLGEYFRTFLAYGVIGVALALHVWTTNRKSRPAVE
jgi:simple sugar transport system permease protein